MAMTKNQKTALWVILGIFIFVLICVGVWFMFFRIKCDWKMVNTLVSDAAAKYKDAAGAEKIIAAGVNDIKKDGAKMKEAAAYAKSHNMAIERVIVDSALAAARQQGYLQ